MRVFYSILISLLFLPTGFSKNVISIHSPNFFLLQQQKELFYPKGINADFLLHPSLTIEDIHRTLSQWKSAGANTIRIRVDSTHAPDDPLDLYLEKNGELKPAILASLDRVIDAAEKKGLSIVLVLFDLQRMAQNWDHSPFNQKNGGPSAQLKEWFQNSIVITKALARTGQLIQRYKNRNILAWEVGRGANVWDLNKRPNVRLMEAVTYWVVRIANHIRKEDDQKHLTALSILPNTYPETLLGLPQINIHFVQIQGHDSTQAALAVSPYLTSIRNQYRKPVFIVEHNWHGDAGEWEAFLHNVFWSSFATGSGMFLSPVKRNNSFRIPDAEFHLFRTLDFILPEFDLSGVPRKIVSPIQLNPPDSYGAVESVLGMDRFFWIFRRKPSQERVKISLQTVEGQYSLQWFDIEQLKKYPRKDFILLRKTLMIETPPFERDVLGLIHLEKRKPSKSKPPAETTGGHH